MKPYRRTRTNKTNIRTKYTPAEKERIAEEIQPYLDEEGNLKPLGRGRPPKIVLEAQASGVIKRQQKIKNPLGRPKEDEGRILEFKAVLMSTKGERVLHKILDTALEDGHPAQSACMKMCMDRMLPVSYFDKEKVAGDSKPQININISSAVSDNKPKQPVIDVSDVEIKEDE